MRRAPTPDAAASTVVRRSKSPTRQSRAYPTTVLNAPQSTLTVDEDRRGRPGFAESREHVGDAVVMSFRAYVGHSVDGKGDVEPMLVGLACSRLDPSAGGDAGDNDLGDVQCLQPMLEIRAQSPPARSKHPRARQVSLPGTPTDITVCADNRVSPRCPEALPGPTVQMAAAPNGRYRVTAARRLPRWRQAVGPRSND